MSFGLSVSVIEALQGAMGALDAIHRAVIFGSRAMGNYKPGSDVDLAIFCTANDEETALQLSVVLNQELPLPYRFDVVPYNTIDNPGLREHIDRYGIQIYP